MRRFRLWPLLRRWCLLCASLLPVLLLAACVSAAAQPPSDEPFAEPPPLRAASSSRPAAATPLPLRLRIPSIGIDAAIEPVGLTPSGELAVPSLHPWDDVGWYSNGPRPGRQGSAVIDGHLDRPGGLPAVFWRLHELQPGADVQVLLSNGQTLHFRVTALAYYRPNAAPLQEIFGDSAGVYLNLITCAGDWIPSEHQTTLRLVVYTSLAQR
jgi:sortase (surface protein transpeptidase)